MNATYTVDLTDPDAPGEWWVSSMVWTVWTVWTVCPMRGTWFLPCRSLSGLSRGCWAAARLGYPRTLAPPDMALGSKVLRRSGNFGLLGGCSGDVSVWLCRLPIPLVRQTRLVIRGFA